MTTAQRARSIRRRGSRSAGKNEPVRSSEDAQLDVARLGRQKPAAAAVAVGRALVAPLVPAGADRLVGLELDELLEDEGHRVAHDVGAATGADGVEQFGQGRL